MTLIRANTKTLLLPFFFLAFHVRGFTIKPTYIEPSCSRNPSRWAVDIEGALALLENTMAPKEERLDAGRRAQGHNGGSTPMRAGELPGFLTYGEFDLGFFTELICRASLFRRGLDGSSAALSPSHDRISDSAPAGEQEAFLLAALREVSSGLRFVDCGSGVGRLVHAAALLGAFESCRGIEIVEDLHRLAIVATERLEQHRQDCADESARDIKTRLASITLLCCDLNSELAALHDADVLFAYSSTWPAFGNGLTEFSAIVGSKCVPGSIVVTTDRTLVADGQPWEFELLHECEGRNQETGGISTAYLWRVKSSLASPPESGSVLVDRRQVIAKTSLGSATLAFVLASSTSAPIVSAVEATSKPRYSLERTEDEWASILSDQQFFVLRQGGTEAPNSSPLSRETRTGSYLCAGCGSLLFYSSAKFEARTGWPSFASAVDSKVVEVESSNNKNWLLANTAESIVGVTVRCSTCGSRLGERFSDGTSFPSSSTALKTGKRYSINGAALDFSPEDEDSRIERGDDPSMTTSSSRREYEWRMRDGGLRSI